MRLALLLALAFASAGSARAADCSTAVTQADLDACAAQQFQQADARLNADYRQILARLRDDAATASRFTAAQRAWLGFRDAECDFTTSQSLGGSIYPMLVSMCRADLTQKRVKDFEGYLHCGEGDMNCPVPSR